MNKKYSIKKICEVQYLIRKGYEVIDVKLNDKIGKLVFFFPFSEELKNDIEAYRNL